jgi:hypothetical protein
LTQPTFGRPINFFFRQLIFFFTVRDGHLQSGFLFSLLLIAVNGYLFFLLLRRQLGFRRICRCDLLSALSGGYFPADPDASN